MRLRLIATVTMVLFCTWFFSGCSELDRYEGSWSFYSISAGGEELSVMTVKSFLGMDPHAEEMPEIAMEIKSGGRCTLTVHEDKWRGEMKEGKGKEKLLKLEGEALPYYLSLEEEKGEKILCLSSYRKKGNDMSTELRLVK